MLDTKKILSGEVVQSLRPPSLREFLELLQSRVATYFPSADPRLEVAKLSTDIHMFRMHQLREEIKTDPIFLEAFHPLWQELGIDFSEVYLDALRIRCVPNLFQEIPEAQSLAYLHRDPWYANPQCQLNFWIPIYEVAKGDGFRIYPDYFTIPISNNSGLFSYDEWIELGGFQSNGDTNGRKKIFPSPDVDPDVQESIDVCGEEGEMVCFASHHLHGTSPNLSGKARFSLEVRFVLKSHLEQRIGPRRIDNFSTGTSLQHMYDLIYRRPVSPELIAHYEAGVVLH